MAMDCFWSNWFILEQPENYCSNLPLFLLIPSHRQNQKSCLIFTVVLLCKLNIVLRCFSFIECFQTKCQKSKVFSITGHRMLSFFIFFFFFLMYLYSGRLVMLILPPMELIQEAAVHIRPEEHITEYQAELQQCSTRQMMVNTECCDLLPLFMQDPLLSINSVRVNNLKPQRFGWCVA